LRVRFRFFRRLLSAALVAGTHISVSEQTASAQPDAHSDAPADTTTPPAVPSPPPPPDETPPSTPSSTSTSPSFGPKDSPFAPPPNLSRNPIDVLPGDVVYPPLGDKPARPVLWNPEWPRFSAGDWIITATGAAITVAAAIIPPQSKHSLSGGIGVDDSARKALRLPTPEGRYVARDGSDVILSFEATWPFFVDALITTWWYRGSPDAAAQMALVDGEALAIVTAIQGATNTIVSRERPYGQTCGSPDLPGATNDCEGNVRYRSFFSGHSAFTFMAAGLVCVHHEKLDLFGGGAADHIACVTAYTGAAATATMRVMGDMHYLSDIAVGASVGTLVGLAVPLLHYRRINLAPTEKAAVDWTLIPVGAGLGVGGTF
jgi:membrane-associated phospholipid phosphatase